MPFRRDDLHNITAVIEQHRSFSDSSEIYDSRVEWKKSLRAVAHSTYESDFAMHEALKAEHKNFQNGHVAYTGMPQNLLNFR